jgi:hypothetical protein
MHMPLTRAGFLAAVVEAQPVDFRETADEHGEVIGVERALLRHELPSDDKQVMWDDRVFIQYADVRR